MYTFLILSVLCNSFVILKNPWPSPGESDGQGGGNQKRSRLEQEKESGGWSQKSETMNTAVIISLASDTGHGGQQNH